MFFKKKSKDEKTTLNLESLKKKADFLLEEVKKGNKDKINFVEARLLSYGLDIFDFISKQQNVKLTLTEKDIPVLENFTKSLRQAYDNNEIDLDIVSNYLLGISGLFGAIINYYKGAEWIDEDRSEDGYKMVCNNRIYYLEARVIKLFNKEEGIDLLSFYLAI